MAYDAKTERLISIKKLSGKAQTSNDKGLANEGLPSGLTVSSNTVFGEAITTSPSTAALYAITGQVELIRFPVTFIAGSDTSDGRHGFELKLPSDYVSNSSNPNKGTYPFLNGQSINITSGSLQLIPPSYSTTYEAKPFYGGNATKNSGTQIPILDARDWYMDYFNGIMFQQDPPGTGDHSNNPDFVEAYLYIGKYLDDVITEAGGTGGADPAAQYLVLQATGSLANERVMTPGTGLSGADAGAGNNYTLSIDNSVVATLTGSQFSGNVGVTGSLGVHGDMDVAEYIKHIGDSDTFIQFADDAIGITAGGEQLITISEAVQDIVKIGDGGDVDFQVRTLNDDNTLYIEGSTDRIGIGTNSPSSILHIKEAAPTLTLQRENNSNASTINFIGASANTANSIIHDSSTNDLVFKTFNGTAVEEIMRIGDHYGSPNRQVIFLSGSTMHGGAMHPRNCSDIAFFVSGSIHSIGTSIKGASVFGGDVLASGSITAVMGLTGSLTRLKNGTPYLRSGAGISITTGSLGEVTISRASSGVSRNKSSYKMVSNVSAGTNVAVASSDMSTVNYDPSVIDLLLNGQMLLSGSESERSASTADYAVSGATSIKFAFDIKIDDLITLTILNL